jgi:hypothetical protein
MWRSRRIPDIPYHVVLQYVSIPLHMPTISVICTAQFPNHIRGEGEGEASSVAVTQPDSAEE